MYAHNPDGRSLLARLDGSEWTEFTDGLPPFSSPYQGGEGWFEVAPDGSVWFSTEDGNGCDGVTNFDGESLTHFLRDTCIFAMDVAPEGHVWLLAGLDDGRDLLHTYVITPEAVAASE